MSHDVSKSIGIRAVAEPTWPERCKDEVDALLGRYPEGREQSAILPLLHLSMREREGHYVAVSDMQAIAEIVGCSAAYVDSVCSFYAMFHRHPVGKYVITVCANMGCHLLQGGKALVEHIQESLGIGNGETTADGLITLEITGECLAACDLGPVLQVNTEYVAKVTAAKWDALLEGLKQGKGPDEFLEKLPLMGGANQDEWQGCAGCAPKAEAAVESPAEAPKEAEAPNEAEAPAEPKAPATPE